MPEAARAEPTAFRVDAPASTRRGSIAAPLEFAGRLKQAIGARGVLWSIAAVILGMISLVVIFAYDRINANLRIVREQQSIGYEIKSAGENLDRIAIALLSDRVGDGTIAQSSTMLAAWANAVKRFHVLCPDIVPQANELTRRVERTCADFDAFERKFLPALSAYVERGVPVADDLFAALLGIAKEAGKTAETINDAYSDRYAALIDAHDRSAPAMMLSAGGFLLTSLILILLLGRSATRHHAASQTAVLAHAEAQRSRQQLHDAIEALPVGFELYDKDERLILFNSHYSDMLGHLGGLNPSMIGWSLERMADHLEARLAERYPGRDISTWKAGHLARCRQRLSADLQWENGRTMRLFHVPTSTGGTAMVRMDVSDLTQREEALRASERRFQLLVDSLTDTVFSLNRETRITYLSARVTDLIGFEPEELYQRAVFDVIHPDDHMLLAENLAALRTRRGEPGDFICRVKRKDGSYRVCEVRIAVPEKGANNRGEFAIAGLVRDVEAKQELARRLRDKMEKLNSIVHSTGALVLLVDRDLRIVMANSGVLGFSGLREEQVVGRDLNDLVDRRLNPATLDTWLNADESRELAPLEYDVTLPDARRERRIIRVTANAVRGESGRVEFIVFLGVDETERRRTELQLFDASRLATLGEMASGIAHEINQPLTVIRFAAEGLVEELGDLADDAPLGEARALISEQCARLVSQTDRAAAIIRDLRGFARKPEDTEGQVDVAESLRVAAKMVEEQLRLARIDLQSDFDRDCPPVVGHSSRLQQVVINLLLNARDAILERVDNPVGTITVRVRNLAPDGKVVVTVEDDGPGIPDRALPRLFEPFFTTKPMAKGTGLGLSISYQIVRQMGGTITAENRAEGGARFTVTLDAAPAHAAKPATHTEAA